MNYLPNKKNKSPQLLFLLLVLLCIAVVLPFRTFIGGSLSRIGTPLWQGGDILFVFVTAPVRYLRSQTSLIDENRSLRATINVLTERNALVQSYVLENRELMHMVGRTADALTTATSTNGSAVLARASYRQPLLALVISRPVVSFYDTLIIDRGSADGLRRGTVVFSPGGIVLGELDIVYQHQARVLLYTSSGVQTPVLIGAERLAAVAEGIGGGNFLIRVAHAAPIKLGDSVEALHDEPWVLGTVGNIDTRKSTTLEKVLVKSPVNFEQLKWVIVTQETLPRGTQE